MPSYTETIFLPTKQPRSDERDKLSDSENYYLIPDEINHTSQVGLINLALSIIPTCLIIYYLA